MNGPDAAAVIPAFNEGKTVGGVVAALVASGRFSAVVVVSDGSTDGTAAEARIAGAQVHETANRGKGAALAHGVALTDAPIVCFFDADLVGLTPDHVDRLLAPVVSGERAMNVGLCDRGPFWNALAVRLPLVAGVRALRREVFEAVPDACLGGYKAEIALDHCCETNGLAYGPTLLPSRRLRLHVVPGPLGHGRGPPQPQEIRRARYPDRR
jgi:glycosyltransferase involved in cell wall biosynthesis